MLIPLGNLGSWQIDMELETAGFSGHTISIRLGLRNAMVLKLKQLRIESKMTDTYFEIRKSEVVGNLDAFIAARMAKKYAGRVNGIGLK